MGQRSLDGFVRGMQSPQLIPIVRMFGEIRLGFAFAMVADIRQLAPILFALAGKLSIGTFRLNEKIRNRCAERWGFAGVSARTQEYPAALSTPFGESGIAQDSDMARDAGLALPENLRDFADRQLHRAKQAHDPEPGRIGKGAEEVFGSHCEEDIKIFLYL